MKNNELRRVVITGYGAVTSLGSNVEQIWSAIEGYRLGYNKVTFNDDEINARFFGYIDRPPSKSGFSKKLLKSLPEFAINAMIAADEAISMAFTSKDEVGEIYDQFDCGVISGTGWGGQDTTVTMNDLYRSGGMVNPFTNIMMMHSVSTAAISMNWNLRGYQNTPGAACATGSIAIGDAYEVIRTGRAKMMLAGASESIKSQFNVWTVDVLRALSKEQDVIERACCPFSMDRSGFVMSEGAAYLCLEDYDSAKQRGAKILGEVVGYANYSDAYDMTSPAEDLAARVKSIKDACEYSDIEPSDIDYINAHGTSTPLNDLNETRCIKEAFGGTAYKIPISSTKSYTGHLIAAAGSLESIFCLKTIQTGMIPATANLYNPDPECDLDYVPNHHMKNQTVDTVLNVNYGFGGANSALVFRRV